MYVGSVHTLSCYRIKHGYFSGSSYVSKPTHTHSHGENMAVLMYTAESTGAAMERTKMPNLPNGSKGGFEPGLT